MGIYHRKDTNKFIVRIRNKKLNIDYTKSFPNITLAKKHEIKIKAEIMNGEFLKQDENMTFENAANLYLENVSGIQCKKVTVDGYRAYLRNHILPFFQNKTLCSITKLDFDKFMKELKEKTCKSVKNTKNGVVQQDIKRKLSNETINHIIFFCNAVFGYMVDSEIISKNPVKKIKKLPSDKKEAEFLTTQESLKLLEIAKEHYPKYYPLLFLSIITGLREGEALALTWNDIDLVNNTITVNKTYSKGVLSTPKTKASNRTIKIPNALIEVLKEHKRNVLFNSKNLVFPNQNGNYINCRNLVNRFLKPCLKEAGLKNITWHQLRHTCITAMAENGVKIKYIQKQAGHSSHVTTLKVYSHATDTMEEEAMKALDNIYKRVV